MRRHETDEQNPRLVVRSGVAQPLRSDVGDTPVVARIFAFAGAGIVDDALARALRRREIRKLLADRQMHHADAARDVHGDVLPVEADGVVLEAIVQLADGFDAQAGILKPVAPARHAPVIGDGIVPVAGVVGEAAGRETGPRGHADRAIRIGIRELRAARGERIEVRRLRQRMAGAAKHSCVVLVGHQHEHVLRFDAVGLHEIPPARTFRRPIACHAGGARRTAKICEGP